MGDKAHKVPVFDTHVSAQETRLALDSYDRWYHRFRFRSSDGEVLIPQAQQRTGLIWKALNELGLPEDAKGLRVLDIGCCDGFFSFAMERRGAEVHAFDYKDVSGGGFGVARSLIGSDLMPGVATVYELDPDEHGLFDVVLFLGVLYHLRHPILGLDRIRAVMRPGALIFVETGLSPATGTATSEFHPRDTRKGNWTNWFRPNAEAVEAWLDTAEFEPSGYLNPVGARGCFAARAIEDAEVAFFREIEWEALLREQP